MAGRAHRADPVADTGESMDGNHPTMSRPVSAGPYEAVAMDRRKLRQLS